MAANIITIEDYLNLGFEDQKWWETAAYLKEGRAAWRTHYDSPERLMTSSNFKLTHVRSYELDLVFIVKNINQVRKVMTIYGAFT